MVLWVNQILSSVPPYSTQAPSKLTPNCHSLIPNSTVSVGSRPKRRCDLYDLHKKLVPYADAWAWQNAIVKEKQASSQKNEDLADSLIILQHHPVYTLGAGSSEEYLNFDVKNAPFDLYRTERGGEVTYHGPGQLVMYPIINLRHYKMDLHWYLRALEEVVIRALSSAFAIKASRIKGLTGVWVGNQKLAAIGVKVSRWITYHGLALNVTTDIRPFQLIVPCGIQDRQVGSIKGMLKEKFRYEGYGEDNSETDDCELIDIAHRSLITMFCEVFQVDLYEKKPESFFTYHAERFVDEACHQIERNERHVRQVGVLSYIPRFAALATRMEQYIQGQSRDLVDQAYTKFVTVMFATLEKIAQADPKYADIILLENYAAFQNSLYDLANIVPTLAKFYHQASESYEQACTRFISTIIYYQFERLFQFARRIEDLMYTITPEEIPFQLGLSKMDLRKVVKSSLSGVDKSIGAMYKRLHKNLTSEELLPSLWDKCKKEFLDKYESFAQLVAKIYPNESIPAVSEKRDLLASM